MSEPLTQEQRESIEALRVQAASGGSFAAYRACINGLEFHLAALHAKLAVLEVELEECKHQNGISAREMQLEARVTALSEALTRIVKTAGATYDTRFKVLAVEIAQHALTEPAQAKEDT